MSNARVKNVSVLAYEREKTTQPGGLTSGNDKGGAGDRERGRQNTVEENPEPRRMRDASLSSSASAEGQGHALRGEHASSKGQRPVKGDTLVKCPLARAISGHQRRKQKIGGIKRLENFRHFFQKLSNMYRGSSIGNNSPYNALNSKSHIIQSSSFRNA